MAIDSAAELLFKINADGSDAEGNIQRFRALMGKDLDEIAADFQQWSDKVLGNLSTVQGAMMAGGAVLAAGLVAAGAAAVHAADAYAAYVEEIDHGSKVTGIAAEQMSGLHFAAEETGVSYDMLVRGISVFENNVVKANQSTEAQRKFAHAFGVTTQQVAAGERDIMPLLLAAADRFHNLASGTERAALARQYFSRGGVEMLAMLSRGSGELKKFADHAKEMGLVISTQDVIAMREFKAATEAADAQMKAIDLVIGRETLPIMENLRVGWAALIMTIKQGAVGDMGLFTAHLSANMAALKQQIADMAKGAQYYGTGTIGGGDDVKQAKNDYAGLTDILESVKEKVAGATGEWAKQAQELSHLHLEVTKATAEFEKLRRAGELTPDAIAKGKAAIAALPTEIFTLSASLAANAAKKSKEGHDKWLADLQKTMDEGLKVLGEHDQAVLAAGENLRARINSQSEKGLEEQSAAWNAEIAKLREELQKKGELTAENEALLQQLQKAGLDKIARDKQTAFEEEMTKLHGRLTQMLEAEMSHADQIRAQYDKDLAEYGRAQMEKTILAAGGEAHRAEIEKQYAAIRTALLLKEQSELQTLQNSQGWRGVFGDHFASLIKGDEALSKEWAQSQDQAQLLVRVSLEATKEMAQQTFQAFANAEGQAIAQAFIYSKSIGQAMEEALKATLASLAGRALAESIYSTALGLLYLASGMEEKAVQAFTAATMFGYIAAGSGVAARYLPGGSTGVSSSSPGPQPGSTGVSYGNGYGGQQQAAHVTVNVYGHIVGTSGISQLTSMINDAVLNQDVTLTATNTRTGQVVTR